LTPRLQWSHVLPNVETHALEGVIEVPHVASMEPRPSERGNLSGGHEPDNTETLQWSHVLPNVETRRESAARAASTALQWSHVLPNVETALSAWAWCLAPSRFNGATSFRTWKPQYYAAVQDFHRCFNGATSFRTWKRWRASCNKIR